MILVTGAAGFVGTHLVDRLTTLGVDERLRLFDMRHCRTPAQGRVEVMRGSIEYDADVAEAVKGAAVVVHLAACVDPASDDHEHMVRVNIRGTERMFRASMAAGCRHFVHVSSAGVYGLPRGSAALNEDDDPDPHSPYQRTKWLAELALQAVDAKTTTLNVLRPTGIYGVGSKLELKRYKRLLRRSWSLGLKGNLLLNPLHVSEFVSAICALIKTPAPHGSVFNVGGPCTVSMRELDSLVVEALAVTHRRIVLPVGIARPLARLLRPVRSILGWPGPLTETYARGGNLSSVVNDSRFRERYPDVPRRPLADGIREHVAWAQAECLI